MSFTVNFDDVDSGLELGSYVGIVKGVNKQIDEKKNTVLISFSVQINGKEYRTKLYNTDGKGKFFLRTALENLGVEIGKGSFSFDDYPFKGIKAEFEMTAREYNGTTYKNLEPRAPMGRASEEELLDLEGATF
jgi:hypothetical protein